MVLKDLKEAARYYWLAADKEAPAQCNLGSCYKNGDGVPKDLKEAIRYYRLAADQNVAPAIEALKTPIFVSFVVSSLPKTLDEYTGVLAIIPCLLECDVCKKVGEPNNYCVSCEELG